MKLGEWRDEGRAPYTVVRGAAVVDNNVAYFVHYAGQIILCSYNSSTQRWNKLPKCPYGEVSLAIIKGLLTAIGGHNGGSDVTNKLVSIINDHNKVWVEHFPPMPTKRHNTAAVTTKQHLIVTGGERRSNQ